MLPVSRCIAASSRVMLSCALALTCLSVPLTSCAQQPGGDAPVDSAALANPTLVVGSNELVVTTARELPTTIGDDPSEIVVDYGWGMAVASEVERTDDHTLSVVFDVAEPEPALDDASVAGDLTGAVSILGTAFTGTDLPEVEVVQDTEATSAVDEATAGEGPSNAVSDSASGDPSEDAASTSDASAADKPLAPEEQAVSDSLEETVRCEFAIARPALTSQATVAAGDTDVELSLDLADASFADGVGAESVVLDGAFSGMTVAGVERTGDTAVRVQLAGTVREVGDEGQTEVDGSIALSSSATTSALAPTGSVALGAAGAYPYEDPSWDARTGLLKIPVALEGCTWREGVSVADITLTGSLADATVDRVERSNDDHARATVYVRVADTERHWLGGIVFGAAATSYGSELGVDVDFETVGLFADVVDAQRSDGTVSLSILARPEGVDIERVPAPEELVLGEGFSQATVASVDKTDEGLQVQLSFASGAFEAADGTLGTITVPDDCLVGVAADLDPGHFVMSVSNFRDDAGDAPALDAAASYRGDAVLSAAVYVPGQAQFAQADFVEAASSTVLGWVRSGVSQLAGSRFASVGDSILSFLGIPNTSTEAEILKEVREIKSQMAEVSNRLDSIDRDIVKLINSVETGTFRNQMTDFENGYLALNGALDGYQSALSTLLEQEAQMADAPDDEALRADYDAGYASFASQVNRGWSWHTSTIAFGSKLSSSAAGTGEGALAAHEKWFTTHYNWESQIYEERCRFYLYSFGTYLQAATVDAAALNYAIVHAPSSADAAQAQTLLNNLSTQIATVSKLAEEYAVHQLAPGYDVSLRANVAFQTTVEKASYSTRESELLPRAEVWRRTRVLQLAKQDARGDYVFTADDLGIVSDDVAATVMKYSSASSLVEELRSVGTFTVPANAPNAAVTSTFTVNNGFVNVGAGNKWDFYTVHYHLFTKSAEKRRFDNIAVAGSIGSYHGETDLSRVNVTGNRSARPGEEKFDASVIRTRAVGDDIYVPEAAGSGGTVA